MQYKAIARRFIEEIFNARNIEACKELHVGEEDRPEERKVLVLLKGKSFSHNLKYGPISIVLNCLLLRILDLLLLQNRYRLTHGKLF